MIQKIFYVYDRVDSKFLGYVVGMSLDDAEKKAASSTGKDPAELRLEDTGKTKPKCCPRK